MTANSTPPPGRETARPANSQVAQLRVMPWRGTDEELLTLLRRGGEVAGAALYDRYAPTIRRLVWRLLGGDEEHDDVVQQVFLHALSSMGTLRDPEALEGWLVGITVNTVRREIRGRRFRPLGQGRPISSRRWCAR